MGPGREVGKGYRSSDPCARPERCVRDGDLFLLLLCARVGCAWVCVSVRPGFSMCRGGAFSSGGDQELLLVQLGCCFCGRAAGTDTFLASAALAVVWCCAVLCCCASRPGPWAPLGMVWRGRWRWRWGSSLVAWVGMESDERGDLTDEGRQTRTETRGRARAKRRGGSAEVSRQPGTRAGVLVGDTPVGSPAWFWLDWVCYCGLGSKIFT